MDFTGGGCRNISSPPHLLWRSNVDAPQSAAVDTRRKSVCCCLRRSPDMQSNVARSAIDRF
jgi:hypothetical protein